MGFFGLARFFGRIKVLVLETLEGRKFEGFFVKGDFFRVGFVFFCWFFWSVLGVELGEGWEF